MFVQNYGEKVREPLLRECGGSQILMEQYLDFLVNRTFRQTLLVKQERGGDNPLPARSGAPARARIRGRVPPETAAPLTLDAREQPCNAMRNLKVTLRLPVHKAVAQVLDEHYPGDGVDRRADRGRVGAHRRAARSRSSRSSWRMLEELLILGAVRIRRSAAQAAAEVSGVPRWRWPRFAVRPAWPSTRARPPAFATSGTSRSGCRCSSAACCRCSTATHSHEALAEHLAAEARAERLRFIKDDKPLTEPEALREFTQQQVALALRRPAPQGVAGGLSRPTVIHRTSTRRLEHEASSLVIPTPRCGRHGDRARSGGAAACTRHRRRRSRPQNGMVVTRAASGHPRSASTCSRAAATRSTRPWPWAMRWPWSIRPRATSAAAAS